MHSRLRDDRARRRERLPDRAGGAHRTGRGEVHGPDAARRHRSPNGYTLTFDGQGGAPGFAKGDAKVRCARENGAATTLSYTVKAQVGGKIAQIGSRLVDGAAQKLADDFFARFSERSRRKRGGAAAPWRRDAAPRKEPWVRYVAIAIIVGMSRISCPLAR
jgi:hypothetical protein